MFSGRAQAEALKLLPREDQGELHLLIVLTHTWHYILETLRDLNYHLPDLLWDVGVGHHHYGWALPDLDEVDLVALPTLHVLHRLDGLDLDPDPGADHPGICPPL